MPVHFPKVKATFIHVPKTGGTSFYHWIDKNIKDFDRLDDNNYATGSVDGAAKVWGDLGIVFSFVRNPYSRLVSMYEYMYAEAVKEISRHVPGGKLTDSYMDHLKLISVSKKGFDYWVTSICTDSPEIYSIYDGDPNTINVCSWYNQKIPDIIIKTEDLDKEFYKIQDLLTDGLCRDPIPWVNTTKHKPYQDYYNDVTRKLVSKKFAQDLDTFKYTFTQ
jgi:Sulfotransferase family